MNRILKLLGSLAFAIFLLSALVLILAVSTTLESLYGTTLVQKFFYQAGWFDVLLGLFWVNIFCATVLRWPFKKHHTGFVVTHIGILTLLAGSLLTRLFGVDGQMALYESQKSHQILRSTYELVLHDPDGQTVSLDLNSKMKGRSKSTILGGEALGIRMERLTENGKLHAHLKNDPTAPINYAAELSLRSDRTGVNQTVWLVERDPRNPESASFSMGPARFELRREKTVKKETETPAPTTPQLFVEDKKTKESVLIDLQKIPAGLDLKKASLRLSEFRYYPNARVEDNKVVSISDEPLNPAIEFKAADDKGHERSFVYFALFPDFESIHGRNKENPIDLKIEFLLPESHHSHEIESSNSPSLTLYTPSKNEPWRYASKSSRAETAGEIKAGQTYETGWMDFHFEVLQLLENAVSVTEVHESEGRGQMAVRLSVTDSSSKILFEDWVIENEPKAFTLSSGNKVMAGIVRKNTAVPFILELKDFRKVDYPGTNKPQSFESDVALTDPAEQIKIEKTIKMNKPLDYKGYRIFQSSYIQDPENGEASVFTVAKDPGIAMIYVGSGIMFLGVVLIFYISPFSPDNQKRK